MANKNQHFAELEYCFGQYFSRYCAPVITKDYNYYRRKQADEFNKAYNEVPAYIGAGSVMQGMVRMQAANINARSSGEWSRKNLDDFINGVVDKIVAGRNFQKDWGNLVDRYRESLIAKLGTKGYLKAAETLGKSEGQKFIDPAVHYGQIRFMEMIKGHLARTDMPKSSMDYILKEAANSSIMMTLGNRFQRARDLSPAEEEIHELGNKLHKPSKTEKAGAFLLGGVFDAPGIDGIGSIAAVPLKGAAKGVSSLALKGGAVKFGTWLGEIAAAKTAAKASYMKGLMTSAGIDAGFSYWASSKVSLDTAKKQYSKLIFGNEESLSRQQKSACSYRKAGTEYISNVNDGLGRKIKIAPIRSHVSNDVSEREANKILDSARGNSAKLLNTIRGAMTHQAIPFNDRAPLPAWMLQKTSRQCRAFAGSFFAIAQQMSTQGLRVWNINGRNMTLAQVAQRADDYARAAVQIDKAAAGRKAARAAACNSRNAETAGGNTRSQYTWDKPVRPVVGNTAVPLNQGNAPLGQNVAVSVPDTAGTVPQPITPKPETAGWGTYLDNTGMNGFSDISRNLGYVLAMLPDMLIGMFTGRTSSFTMGNNILPLAAIAAGLFSRNPLLKLMFMGFGGMNLLNNAGHEILGIPTPAAPSRKYRQYADEPLNPRLSNVAMRGRSLIADIDNNPVVINISDTAVDAFEKKAIPLNTLANAVLRKYDENRTVAANSYDQNLASAEEREQQRGYGLK